MNDRYSDLIATLSELEGQVIMAYIPGKPDPFIGNVMSVGPFLYLDLVPPKPRNAETVCIPIENVTAFIELSH